MLLEQVLWVLAATAHLAVVFVAGLVYQSAGLKRVPVAFPNLWRLGVSMVAIDALVSLVRVAASCSVADLLGFSSLALSCASGVISALLAYGLWRRRGVIAVFGAAMIARSVKEEQAWPR